MTADWFEVAAALVVFVLLAVGCAVVGVAVVELALWVLG